MNVKRSQFMGWPQSSPWLWLGLLLYMAVIGLYFLSRYDGYWAEADSSAFTRYIREMANQGKLMPESTNLYPNGYAYQAISTFLVSLTGLRVATLQQWVYPLLATLVVLPAWITYRELTRSNLGATLSTLFLFTQPEFLFVIMRSSHEKFTRTLILLCLFLLSRSIAQSHPRWRLAVYLGLIYFITYALISSNYLLANSFIFAMATAYVLGLIIAKLKPNLEPWNRNLAKRFGPVILVCFGLVYIFTSYIYPPARHNIRILHITWDLITSLFLELQTQRTDIFVAYHYTTFGWVNLPTYFVLSIANWLVLAASSAIWLRQGWNWIWRSHIPKHQTAWLLWLFYTALVIQGMLAIVSDASGALGSNLQLRLFPSFSMIGVAMIGTLLAEWRPQRFARLTSLGFTVAVFCVSILSVLKVTNEPLFSNKWNFYDPAEILALEWGDAHLTNTELWTEFDERLYAAYLTEIGDPTNRFTSVIKPNTRNMMLSTIIRLRSNRIAQPLSVPPDALQVYDNGTAQLYHLRPFTPYQP